MLLPSLLKYTPANLIFALSSPKSLLKLVSRLPSIIHQEYRNDLKISSSDLISRRSLLSVASPLFTCLTIGMKLRHFEGDEVKQKVLLTKLDNSLFIWRTYRRQSFLFGKNYVVSDSILDMFLDILVPPQYVAGKRDKLLKADGQFANCFMLWDEIPRINKNKYEFTGHDKSASLCASFGDEIEATVDIRKIASHKETKQFLKATESWYSRWFFADYQNYLLNEEIAHFIRTQHLIDEKTRKFATSYLIEISRKRDDKLYLPILKYLSQIQLISISNSREKLMTSENIGKLNFDTTISRLCKISQKYFKKTDLQNDLTHAIKQLGFDQIHSINNQTLSLFSHRVKFDDFIRRRSLGVVEGICQVEFTKSVKPFSFFKDGIDSSVNFKYGVTDHLTQEFLGEIWVGLGRANDDRIMTGLPIILEPNVVHVCPQLHALEGQTHGKHENFNREFLISDPDTSSINFHSIVNFISSIATSVETLKNLKHFGHKIRMENIQYTNGKSPVLIESNDSSDDSLDDSQVKSDFSEISLLSTNAPNVLATEVICRFLISHSPYIIKYVISDDIFELIFSDLKKLNKNMDNQELKKGFLNSFHIDPISLYKSHLMGTAVIHSSILKSAIDYDLFAKLYPAKNTTPSWVFGISGEPIVNRLLGSYLNSPTDGFVGVLLGLSQVGRLGNIDGFRMANSLDENVIVMREMLDYVRPDNLEKKINMDNVENFFKQSVI